jgi:hypothetical protein
MNTKGIRISDLKEGKCVPLSELLDTIPNGNQLNWNVLWFDVTPIEKEGKLLTEVQKKIKESKEGISYTFESLSELSKKIFQEIEVLVIGSKNRENTHRYKDDQEMYESCDIVIEMIDGSFWEIFSKDPDWIEQLTKKYREIEILAPDFQKK